MPLSNPYEGLFPGDYFIHRMNFDDEVVHAYGFLVGKDHDGNLHSDYQCCRTLSQPTSLEGGATTVVGRITQSAYKLAKLRGWPDEDSAVLSIIAFSGGQLKEAS